MELPNFDSLCATINHFKNKQKHLNALKNDIELENKVFIIICDKGGIFTRDKKNYNIVLIRKERYGANQSHPHQKLFKFPIKSVKSLDKFELGLYDRLDMKYRMTKGKDVIIKIAKCGRALSNRTLLSTLKGMENTSRVLERNADRKQLNPHKSQLFRRNGPGLNDQDENDDKLFRTNTPNEIQVDPTRTYRGINYQENIRRNQQQRKQQ